MAVTRREFQKRSSIAALAAPTITAPMVAAQSVRGANDEPHLHQVCHQAGEEPQRAYQEAWLQRGSLPGLHQRRQSGSQGDARQGLGLANGQRHDKPRAALFCGLGGDMAAVV